MKRPREHVVDTAGSKQFETVMPNEWVTRSMPSDYGIDYEVEISRDGETTGNIFKVQLKSTEEPDCLVTKDVVSFSLDLPHLTYICNEITIPMFIIVADISAQRTWWYAPQIDLDLSERLRVAVTQGQSSIALHIPMDNILPVTLDSMIRAYSSCNIFLSSRTVSEVDLTSFVKVVAKPLDSETFAESLYQKADALLINRLEESFQSEDNDKIEEAIKSVLENPESSIDLKFGACLLREKVIRRRGLTDGGRCVNKEMPGLARFLRKLTREGPDRLKYYAAVVYKSVQLSELTNQDYGLYMNWRVVGQNKDSFWLLDLANHRATVAVSVREKYNQCARLLTLILEKKLYWIFPRCVARILQAMSTFLLRLWGEGLTDIAIVYREKMLVLVSIAMPIAAHMKDWDSFTLLVFATLLCAKPNDEGSFEEMSQWVRARIAELIDDKKLRKKLHREIDQHKKELCSALEAMPAEEEMSTDDEREIYERMAEALGIDLDNPEDRIAKIVRIGIQDLNPERVLRNCRHLFVHTTSHGLPADMLQLPTAGSKAIRCVLHGYGVEGLSLDRTYSTFEVMHCGKCNDVSPHEDGWQWTKEWQQGQNQIHEKLLEQYWKSRG